MENGKIPASAWKEMRSESLTITFLEMWNAIKKNLPSDRSFEPYLPDEPYKAVQHGYVQPYADSPLDDEQVGEEVYISMANKQNITAGYYPLSDHYR